MGTVQETQDIDMNRVVNSLQKNAFGTWLEYPM